jgi:hypothetical protein
MWSGSAGLFKVSAVTALMLLVYFALRVANQEFAPWRFKTLKHWIREQGHSAAWIGQGQLAFLSAHIGLSLLLCAPLLVWAGAISRTPADRIAVTLLLLLFYALSYGIWGLAGLTMASALFYLPLNPVAYLLAYLSRQELAPLSLFGWQWPAALVHFTFHILLGAAGYAAHHWALHREVWF